MEGVVKAGGYDNGVVSKKSLATPQASKKANVYELPVDVFYSLRQEVAEV